MLRSRLRVITLAAGLTASCLSGISLAQAPPSFATSCPTGFTLVTSTTVCERAFQTAGTQTWTVPAGISSIDVLVVGAGGAGGIGTSSNAGGGGGGGGGAVITGYTVSEGGAFSINVDSSTDDGDGQWSTFKIGTTLLARGNYGRNGRTSSYGSGGTGGLGTGVTGATFNGAYGQNPNVSSAATGTLVNQGLFAYGSPQTWSYGGGAGGTSSGSSGNTGSNAYTPNSGSGGGGGKISSAGTVGAPGENGIVIIRTLALSRDLSSISGPSSTASNDAAFTTQPVVRLTDSGTSTAVSGVVVTATIASHPGGSPSLQGTTTATTDASGDAAFSDLAIRGPVGDYTLSFSATGASDLPSSTITLSAGAATASQSVISTASATVGTELTTVVTVQAKDSAGSSLTTGGDTVVLTPTAGSVGAITDNGDGTYTATYTAPSTTGSVTISGTLNGSAIGTSATITVKGSQTVSWSPTNTALTMPGSTITPSSFASTSGDGTITYAVQSAGTSGCTISSASSPFTLTYTAPGTCTVRASAAGTATYAAALADVDFVASLAAQSITANSTSTRLRPGQTATVSDSGSIGSGAITWTNTTPGVCTVTGTTVTADADGSCVLTVSIAADSTYAAASDSITLTVFTPGSSGGGGGGSGGGSGGGTSGSGGSGSSGPGSATSSSAGGTGADGSTSGGLSPAQSQDGAPVPGTGSTTRGRTLPPPPVDVQVRPVRNGLRSSVLIKQPTQAAGSLALATIVVVRNAEGKVISRVNVSLKSGQGEIEVTVPYVADGYTVDVYNVNEVGVSTGALSESPLVRATTITKRTASGRPSLFGAVLGKPIIFNGGSAVLDKRDKRQLRAIAQAAKESNERLFVTGFARKGGGSASELASLSTKRARAAATYLSKQGVRVWIRYWGAGSLNGTGQTSDRRVEVRTSAAPIPRSLVP